MQTTCACDVAVVGGGPAGLAAALGAKEGGAARVVLFDREKEAGGILWQCIHAGFGLHHFKEELTGPEYAQRFLDQARAAGVEIMTETFVLGIDADRRVRTLSPAHGMQVWECKAVVLAMGARERTRPAIHTPGTRPAGVMTAGLAQKLVNIMGFLPGRRAVILGSGDIGLIMARRLTLEGVEVEGVYEIMPHPGGLNRNIVQCLHDYDIPLHLSTTVSWVHGRDRVEGVTVTPVDSRLQPVPGAKGRFISCDTLLLAVGLIPENELSLQTGLALDPATGGPVVSSTMETTVPGIYACGNVLHIHDLVDYVTEEAMVAGWYAAGAVDGRRPDTIRLVRGPGIASCVPHTLSNRVEREQVIYLRVRQPMENCRLHFGEVFERRLRYAFPAETVRVTIKPEVLAEFPDGDLTVYLSE
ncbi:MAG TPA: FAD-dependent oxidoreductase [Firmicutes bacterium]|nr:FAD-dependent oxidoreductase [Bacillota bacterium]